MPLPSSARLPIMCIAGAQPIFAAFFDGSTVPPSAGLTWKRHYFAMCAEWKCLAQERTGALANVAKLERSDDLVAELRAKNLRLEEERSERERSAERERGLADVGRGRDAPRADELHEAGLTDLPLTFYLVRDCYLKAHLLPDLYLWLVNPFR